MNSLAQLSNVHCKLSGLWTEAGEAAGDEAIGAEAAAAGVGEREAGVDEEPVAVSAAVEEGVTSYGMGAG